MRKLLTVVTLMLSASYTVATVAQADDVGLPADTGDHYCLTCHGAKGQGNIGIQAPRLAGMEDWYLQRQLENFRSGVRGMHSADEQGLAMQPMAAKLSDASIAEIILWVGSWDYVPTEITIDGNINLGRSDYLSCAACHGSDGEGNEAFGAPALAGQNDWYMVTQLKNFRAGFRGAHKDDSYGSQMVPFAAALKGDQAIQNIVSYINTLQK